jgi:histidine triad (HIT) family protein
MAEGCVFCGIAAKKVKATLLYEDDQVLAFPDIAPRAPVHLLIVPKKHIDTANALTAEDAQLAGRLFLTGARLAREKGCAESGYRMIVNCNKDGGQEIFHLHLHLLGGRPLGSLVAR